MIKNKLLYLPLIVLLFLTNSVNFKLTEIVSEGDRRINFNIKNSLLNNSNNTSTDQNKIIIKTTKKKSISEKNIKNEITKYKISINTEITLINLIDKDSQNFSVIKDGVYNVDSKYSVSLNNEKKLINLLIKSLIEEILEKLAEISNDI